MEKKLEEKLFENRILFVASNLSPKIVNETLVKLTNWSALDEKKEINIYLTCSDGNFMYVTPIYDMLQKIKNPINVFCFGCIEGFAPIFLTMPNRGKRYILKHTVIELHQPYGVIRSGDNQETEVKIEADRISLERRQYEEILSEALNKPLEEIHNDIEYGKELDAEAALAYGLVDEILE